MGYLIPPFRKEFLEEGKLNTPKRPFVVKIGIFGLRKWNFLVFLVLVSLEGGEGRKLGPAPQPNPDLPSEIEVHLIPTGDVAALRVTWQNSRARLR